MKTLSTILKTMLVAAPLAFTACASHKKAVNENTQNTQATASLESKSLLDKVNEQSVKTEFISSKVKFSIEVGNLKQSFTGNLRMKRNDVIRLQLMAFGFVEAGRLEFTKDYVLIIDRINKQFLRVPYHHVDFLRKSGINFYTLQAMFWNELFLPGRDQVTEQDYGIFTTQEEGENTVVSLEQERMMYSWLTDSKSGLIRMTNVLYTSLQGENTQLNWDYAHFYPMGRNKSFPDDMHITLNTASKEVKLQLKLNYLGHESDWEPRTEVSSKYNEVGIDDILRRFMAL